MVLSPGIELNDTVFFLRLPRLLSLMRLLLRGRICSEVDPYPACRKFESVVSFSSPFVKTSSATVPIASVNFVSDSSTVPTVLAGATSFTSAIVIICCYMRDICISIWAQSSAQWPGSWAQQHFSPPSTVSLIFFAMTWMDRNIFSGRELTFTFAICDRNSVCRLSVVCDVGAPYSAGWNFRQFFSPYDSPGTVVFWCQKLLVGDTPFPLRFAFKVTHPLSNSEISTNINS